MLKKFGIPTLAAIAMLGVVGAAPAKAGVHFGIGIGGPVYSYPAPAPVPAYPDPYAYDPYAYPYPDYYSTPYVAPVVPYGGFYWGGDRDRDRGRVEHRERGFRGHDDRGFRGHEGRRR